MATVRPASPRHPALYAASMAGRAVVPAFVWAREDEGPWTPGPAARWWLQQSLRSLSADLERIGSKLVLRRGPAALVLPTLAHEVQAEVVYWNRRYEPASVATEQAVEHKLRKMGVRLEAHDGALLLEPGFGLRGDGTPYRVFTHFYRAALQEHPAVGTPHLAPSRLRPPDPWPSSEPLQSLQIFGQEDPAPVLERAWQPGERSALRRLEEFVTDGLARYGAERDYPGRNTVSRLSPHLHFGEISPRIVSQTAASVQGSEPFLRQLMWREFAYHLLRLYSETPQQPLMNEFRRFPWCFDTSSLSRWQEGTTGFPIVDAGMRELAATGWMHNRVRLIVASFLTKDLLIHWLSGARHFWERLVDADLANNTLGWQWTAGCGADAAPYFRIFNPTIQGMRFDPDGSYVRAWVPELKGLPVPWIHQPWSAATAVLEAANVHLGKTYPEPIVDHHKAREAALAAYDQMRRRG